MGRRFEINPKHKSMTVSVLGVPNAGKSSLINTLVGVDLSIVTNREQTTRNKFNCVFHVDDTEIVLVDTPGLHKTSKELNKRMNEQAREGARETELNLLLIDLSREVIKQFSNLSYSLQGSLARTWVVFTKCDLIKNYKELPLDGLLEKAKEIFPNIENSFTLSAVTEENVSELVGALCDEAPHSPHMYPFGNISDKPERFFATEYIRQQVFELIKEEIPYEVAVIIEEYKDVVQNEELRKERKMRIDYETALMGKEVRLPVYEEKKIDESEEVTELAEEAPEIEDHKAQNRPEGRTEADELAAQAIKRENEEKAELAAREKDQKKKPKKAEMEKGDVISHISAAILVNRPSQRAIIIGAKGSMIKEIGTRARKKIESLTGHRVFLNLHVKVSPKWFKNNFVLEEIGLDRVQDSARIWRKK